MINNFMEETPETDFNLDLISRREDVQVKRANTSLSMFYYFISRSMR